MKFSILAGAALLASVDAFPNMMNHLRANGVPKLEKKKAAFEHPSVPGFSDLQIRQAVAFDAASQLVDVTGDHAFVAPGPTDQRGPCPGLNAMANHGYLPHDGIATLDQFIEGTGKVFGMGVDLSTFLAVYGAVFDGDGATTWSIGGPDSRVTPLLGLLGTPEGISGSHNKYEGDASPTRGDLYQKGNDYLLQMDQFQALYDLGKADDNYDLQLLTDYRYTRFHESISQNPYFFNAPFSGVVAQPAAWAFIYRFMSNKSAEYPEGRLNGENLKSFYAITGDDGDFTYTPGNERIPDNWYTRNALDQYTIPFLSLDSNTMLLQHLEFGSVGGNTGTPNSFVGVDPGDLTSGVFNADTLTQGNNLMCYGLELSIQETPDILAGIFTDDTNPLNKALSALGDASNSLGCDKLTQINKDQFSNYPGYTASYSGYSPPTAGGIL